MGPVGIATLIALFSQNNPNFSYSEDLHARAYNTLKEGSNAEEVINYLGVPAEYKIEGKVADLSYTKDADICTFMLVSEIVKNMECHKNPDYVSPAKKTAGFLGAVLKGMGEGMRQQNQDEQTCTMIPEGWGYKKVCR